MCECVGCEYGGEKKGREVFRLTVGIQTLSTFLGAVLEKKYTNPSSDVIEVLAGLDHVDTVMTEFVGALEGIIRNGETGEFGDNRGGGSADGDSGIEGEGGRGCVGGYVGGVSDDAVDVFYTEGHVPGHYEGMFGWALG